MIPRPFLLALTLLLVVGAIVLIELRLDAANPGEAETNPQSKEPVMKEQRDQKNEMPGDGEREMVRRAERSSK